MAVKQYVKVKAKTIDQKVFESIIKAMDYLRENKINLHPSALTRIKKKTKSKEINYSGVIFEFLEKSETEKYLKEQKFVCTQCRAELSYSEYKLNDIFPKMPCKECLAYKSKQRRESKKAKILFALSRLDAISNESETCKKLIEEVKTQIEKELRQNA